MNQPSGRGGWINIFKEATAKRNVKIMTSNTFTIGLLFSFGFKIQNQCVFIDLVFIILGLCCSLLSYFFYSHCSSRIKCSLTVLHAILLQLQSTLKHIIHICFNCLSGCTQFSVPDNKIVSANWSGAELNAAPSGDLKAVVPF